MNIFHPVGPRFPEANAVTAASRKPANRHSFPFAEFFILFFVFTFLLYPRIFGAGDKL